MSVDQRSCRLWTVRRLALDPHLLF